MARESSIHRLRPGIERFFITDINNPGAGATAQSTLPVMWDAWMAGSFQQDNWDAVARFNHVPGGSNVLYMDGHVEFVKLDQKVPMLLSGLPTTSVASQLGWILGPLYAGSG